MAPRHEGWAVLFTSNVGMGIGVDWGLWVRGMITPHTITPMLMYDKMVNGMEDR